MSTDAELAASIELNATAFIASLQSATTAFDNFANHLAQTNIGGTVSAGANAASVAIGNMVASATTKLAELGTSVIQAGFAFNGLKEQANIAFTNLLGSGQAARNFLDDLAAFAAKTPFEFPELVRSAQRLTAMGFASREIIPMLTAVGNAVAAMGGSAAQVDRVTTALVQMKAKGKVSAQEMMQLAEAGIPAWEILANKIGVSIPEAMKLGEKGAISASVAIEGLIEGMQNKFGGMMEQQATTWQGMLSTLNDTTAQMAGQIMEPLFNASKDTLTKILAGLPAFQAEFNSTWKEIVDAVGVTVKDLEPIVSFALKDMKATWTSEHSDIMTFTKGAWTIISTAFIKPIVEVGARAVSAAAFVMRNDWVGAMNAMARGTEIEGSIILRILADLAQKALIVPIMIAKGVEALGAAVQGPKLAVSASVPMWFDDPRIKDRAKDTGTKINNALAAGIKGGGKGKSDAEKAMRELLSSINEYVSATGSGVKITEQAWANASESTRQSMIKQRDALIATKEATASLYLDLKGGLLTVYPQLGAAIVDYINKMKQANTITAQMASPKLLEFIQPSKAIASEVKKAEKDLEDSHKKIQKMNDEAAKDAEKAAKKIHDAMTEQFEDLSRKLPDSWNVIIDSIVNGSGKVGDAVYESAIKIKGWAGDILGIVDTLPGKFGDAARGVLSTVDKWVQFGDKVLAVIGKMTGQAELSVGNLVSKIISIFSKGAGAAGGVGGGAGSGIFGAIGGFFGKLFGGGGGGTGAMGTGISEGMAQNASGGILKSLGGFLGIAGIGASLLPSIIGLFKGKSQVQKDTEKAQLDKLKADVAQTYEDIKNTMVDTMAKGHELLESLATRVDVPRKAIKRFVNQLGLLLELFIDESKRLAPMGLEAAKAVTENLGGAFEFMIGAVDLNNAIRGMQEATATDVMAFKNSAIKLFDALFGVYETIEMSVAKQAGKKSERLKSVIEFATAIPDAIKAAVEAPALDPAQLTAVFDSARAVMSEFFRFTDEMESIALKKTSKDAGLLQGIFESGKSMFDFLGMFSNYKPFDGSVLGLITADLQKLFAWSRETLAMVTEGISDVDKLAEALRGLTSSFGGVMSGVGGLTGGGRGSGITSSITYEGSGLSAFRSGGGSSGASTIINNTPVVNVYVTLPNGTIISEGEYLRKTREEVEKALEKAKKELKLASAS